MEKGSRDRPRLAAWRSLAKRQLATCAEPAARHADGAGTCRTGGAVTGIDAPVGFPGKPILIPARTKATILIDNSHLTTAYPELTVSAGRGATVRLTYAEALFDAKGEKGNRNEIAGKEIQGILDEFVPDGVANRVFMPLGWKTWRYLQLDVETADQPLTVEKLRTWFTAYPFEQRGRLSQTMNP